MRIKQMLALMGVLATIQLSACGSADPRSPEQQVRATLEAIELGVEARSMDAVTEHINKDYSDHQGHTIRDIKRLIQLQFIRNQSINIFTSIRSLELTDGVAAVELSAAMSSMAIDLSQESNRLRADTHHFSILLSQQDDKWLVDSVSWARGWQ